MPTIRLVHSDRVVLVDDADWELLRRPRWWLKKPRNGQYLYAATRLGGREVFMHRFLMGEPKRPHQVDHVNGDTLDNRRGNLRVSDQRKNQWNQRRVRGVSRYKGVQPHPAGGWCAKIRLHNRRQMMLGRFTTEREAALAYDAMAVRLRGEHAATNANLGLLTEPERVA